MNRFHDNTEGGQQSVTTRAALVEPGFVTQTRTDSKGISRQAGVDLDRDTAAHSVSLF